MRPRDGFRESIKLNHPLTLPKMAHRPIIQTTQATHHPIIQTTQVAHRPIIQTTQVAHHTIIQTAQVAHHPIIQTIRVPLPQRARAAMVALHLHPPHQVVVTRLKLVRF